MILNSKKGIILEIFCLIKFNKPSKNGFAELKLFLLLHKNWVSLRNKTKTYPHETYKLLVADGLIGFIDRWRTLWVSAVAEAFISTTVVIPAFISEFHLTFGSTTWSL